MGRKVSLASLATTKVEDVPGRSIPTLVRLKPAQIAATPLNPRTSFGTPDELAELGESMRVRQLQPVVTVSRAAYLRLWPEHAEHVGKADFVLANGERRYRSAIQVGLDVLDALIREEVADSREAFLDAVLSENIDRKNFDPIEEAHAVEAMVTECGSATAAAERFRRHKTWISQRRALLRLSPDLQERVRSGELPVRIARSIAALPADQQEAAWHETREREAAESRQRAEDRKRSEQPEAPSSSAPIPSPRPDGRAAGFTAVNTDAGNDEPRTEPSGHAGVLTAVNTPARDNGQGRRPSAGIPWQSPEALAVLLTEKVSAEDLVTLVKLLNDKTRVFADS